MRQKHATARPAGGGLSAAGSRPRALLVGVRLLPALILGLVLLLL